MQNGKSSIAALHRDQHGVRIAIPPSYYLSSGSPHHSPLAGSYREPVLLDGPLTQPIEMRGLLILALAYVPSGLTFRLEQSSGRRAILLCAAAATFSAPPWVRPPPAAALSATELQSILDRAKSEALTTEKVISRAVNNDLIDPKIVLDCKDLAAINMIDKRAAEEIRMANGELMKLTNIAIESKNRKAKALKESLDLGQVVEARINERVYAFDDKYNSECINGI